MLCIIVKIVFLNLLVVCFKCFIIWIEWVILRLFKGLFKSIYFVFWYSIIVIYVFCFWLLESLFKYLFFKLVKFKKLIYLEMIILFFLVNFFFE